MMHRRAIVPLVLATLVAAACGGREGPSPDELAQMRADSIAAARAEQARQDSIARAQEAERMRQDSIAEAQRQRALAEREAARAREIIAERVHFAYDRANISDEAREVLIRKVAVLRANPNVRLRIEGHADERGSVEYNLALGERRAEAVRSFLTTYGLAESRFETVTYGEERPVNPSSNESAWAQNRRAEFRIIGGDDVLTAPQVSS